MRCTILSLLALLFAVTASAQFTNDTPFHLLFDSDNGTNATLRIHSTQDTALPVEQWSVTAQFLGTTATNYFVPIVASPPRQFFAVSASNEWGIVFSDVVVTEPPRSPRALRLVKD